MAFSSVPVYLDHPNWHQQANHQQGSGSDNLQLPPPPPPPQVGGGGGGPIRPGSVVDQARLAQLPLPEAAQNCPRCDSTNTKFCYYNNYSRSQPRHFCKTCRRYWTRGGALRNVPVGGGCRRNKRNKSNCSKPAVTGERKTGSNPTSASPSSCSARMSTGHLLRPPSQLSLMASVQNLNQYGGANIGSNIGGFEPETHMTFQMGNHSGGNSNILVAGGADQWRFPFFTGFEPPTGLFPYQNGVEAPSSMAGESHRLSTATSTGVTHVAPVKVENNQGSNLSRQFLSISSENNQYWGGNTWPELSASIQDN
ncbi:unnamed protein product [Ilex paraguariensis]|uniref:Dof zinc finger protein n=1 Tax=Ilex paraguariensis TaxID=185542 RepID=A0ABC8V5Z8_9AQUA